MAEIGQGSKSHRQYALRATGRSILGLHLSKIIDVTNKFGLSLSNGPTNNCRMSTRKKKHQKKMPDDIAVEDGETSSTPT